MAVTIALLPRTYTATVEGNGINISFTRKNRKSWSLPFFSSPQKVLFWKDTIRKTASGYALCPEKTAKGMAVSPELFSEKTGNRDVFFRKW